MSGFRYQFCKGSLMKVHYPKLYNMSNDALCELAILRNCGYRARLINGAINPADFHVRYNNAKVSDLGNLGELTHTLENHANRNANRLMVRDWMNNNAAQVEFLKSNFSNIVCCIALVFRKKGHHYMYITGPDYLDEYTRLWNKTFSGTETLHATWEQISTIGLHAITPFVLDQFYQAYAAAGRIAPPLQLRVNTPCAGTAAIFALLVGWEDAQSAYGRLLREHTETLVRLKAQVKFCETHRWTHGINAAYYGQDASRLDLSPFSAMAATVAGVYEATAERATLLQSKSLLREASGSPLQRDISSLAARALREVFIKSITNPQREGPRAIAAP